MNNLAIYCKSYRGDLERVKVQASSIRKHNPDNIPYYISVPHDDEETFRKWIPDAIIVCDEEIIGVKNLPPWQSQQIVKSSFWMMGVCKNYMCIDSDQYFIRDFRESDFIVPDTDICYTVMHEQKELFGWTANKTRLLGFDPSQSFGNDRQKIMDIFGRKGRYYDFGPSPTLWSTAVWQSFEKNYLTPNKLTFSQCISYVPSEFSWYGEFLLASRTIPIYPIEPLFKVFHYRPQYDEYKDNAYTESDIAKTYHGICLQGNWGAPMKY